MAKLSEYKIIISKNDYIFNNTDVSKLFKK